MIKSLIQSRLIQYLIVACVVTVLDFVMTIFLVRQGVNMLYANVVGMVMGSLSQFVILYTLVYKVNITITEFMRFESTFFFGLIMSTFIVWVSYDIIHLSAPTAKIAAILITFVMLYMVRERMIRRVREA